MVKDDSFNLSFDTTQYGTNFISNMYVATNPLN